MIKIFDSQSRALKAFEPLQAGKVSIYVCGPTVYDHAHIGHARVYVAFDAVVRYLKSCGHQVTYARNITDIDDKIIARASENQTDCQTHAQTYTSSFHKDMEQLGLLKPAVEPKATETVDEMINMIQVLIDKKFAYTREGDVFFRISEFKAYGALSKKNIDELQAGSRVQANTAKENPLDFVLWKSAKPGEPVWESPWGKGRPGWHIECSAMIHKHFGNTIDIHAGGRDLIFPHHDNEIAQSECCFDHKFVNHWMHNGFVTMSKEKMSKSIGNTLSIKDIFKDVHPEALKFYLLSSHYRSPIEYAKEDLLAAAKGLDKLYRSVHGLCDVLPGELDASLTKTYESDFHQAMCEDFNTAKAIGVLFTMVREMNRFAAKSETLDKAVGLKDAVLKLASTIGLLMHEPKSYFQALPGMESLDVEKIENLICDRQSARRDKDFDRADKIRDELNHMNITLEDAPEGTTWRKL